LLARPAKRKAIAIAVVICLFVAAYLNIRALNPRFLDETVKTLTLRDENWRNLSELIAKRPVFGYGYGKRNYQTVYHRSFPGSVIGYQHAHSLVLQTAFETGAVGLAVILWLFVVVVFRFVKGYASNKNRYGAFMAVLLVSVVGTAIYCLAEVPDGLLRSLFWLFVAMVGAFTATEPEKRARNRAEAGSSGGDGGPVRVESVHPAT
jgi:O-antigen ligase